MAREFTKTVSEEEFAKMMKESPKFKGSFRMKISSQGRASFPSEFYRVLYLGIHGQYNYKERDIILMNPKGGRMFDYLSSIILSGGCIEKSTMAEALHANSDTDEIFKMVPCPLYDAFSLVLMGYPKDNASLLISSSVINLSMDSTRRVLIPKIEGYEDQFKKGDTIYFVGSGPTLDILTETQMENLKRTAK